MPSNKTELDLFSVPPTQAALVPSPPSPHMLHLFKNYLLFELRIRHEDGTNLKHGADVTADPPIGPINLIGKTLFSQIELMLNGTEVFNSGNKYAYRAFLETELNYGADAKDSHLTAALYQKDAPPDKVETDDNAGFQKRRNYFRSSAWVQLAAPVHCDLFAQDR